jgi:hypothetical protein
MSHPEPYNPASASHAAAANRRRGERHAPRSSGLTKVSLAGRDGPAGESVVTCVVDYSTLGVGLIHPAEIPAGQHFYVVTETKTGQLLTRRLLRCSRCTPMDGGRFLIGAEFIG